MCSLTKILLTNCVFLRSRTPSPWSTGRRPRRYDLAGSYDSLRSLESRESAAQRAPARPPEGEGAPRTASRPSERRSSASACTDYAPASCAHRPSLLPIE